MLHPINLPTIQETCLSTAKSTLPHQISTAHLGIADSGARNHFLRETSHFISYITVTGKFIMMANSAYIPVLSTGTVSLTINGSPVRIINCYHTPGLRACLYSLQLHRRSPGYAFVGNQQGIYLTFCNIFTRVQDDIDYRIQLRPLPLHPNLKYDIGHTLEPVPLIATSPSAGSSNTLTQHIPSASLSNPVTYNCPPPNSTAHIPSVPLISASSVPTLPPSIPAPFIVPTFTTGDTQIQRLPSHGFSSYSSPH
jgi:hypothetical protein